MTPVKLVAGPDVKVVDVRFTSDFVLLIRLMQFLLWEIKFLGVLLTISYP